MYYRRGKKNYKKKLRFFKWIQIVIVILIMPLIYILNNKENIEKKNNIIAVAQIKKLETQIVSEETGKTYYISATGTSTDGTDINNPMSLSTANKKTFYGNEKILFKCGDIFYGTIQFKIEAEDGTIGYIGSYGEGDKPIISGASTIINKYAWKKEGEFYKIDISDGASIKGLGYSGYEPNNIGFIRTENGEIFGNRKASKDLLCNEMDFYCEEAFLYVKCTENPNEKYGNLKMVSRNDLVVIYQNTIIDGLNIQDTGAHGIVKKSNDVKNIYIHDCIIQNIGGSILNLENFTRYGNGIEFYNGNVENVLIENNIIRNVYDVAFTMQGTSGYWENILVRNNIFISNTQNSEIWNSGNAQGITNYEFYNNIQINTGRGWGYEVRPNKNVSSNYLVYDFTKNLEASYYNNTSFNTRRIYSISSATLEKFKESIEIYNNNEYYNEDAYILNNNYTINQIEEFREDYNKDITSTFYNLTAEDIEKINNTQILNSNDYTQIKTYYETLENEFSYTDDLDKTPPTIISVTGNPTNWTKNKVTLTVNVSDSLSGLASKAYSFDNGATWQAENTKTYTENTSGIIIKVKDKFNNISTYKTIDITKIATVQKPKTTVESFKKNTTINEIIKIVDKNENDLKEEDIIKTGNKIKTIINNEEIILTTIVIGDTNGDGQADFKDMLEINKHRLNKVQLKDEYLLAGDVTDDGNVDFKDLLQINKYRLGKIDIL